MPHEDAYIYEAISRNACEIFEKQHKGWNIIAFGESCPFCDDSRGVVINRGLMLAFYGDDEEKQPLAVRLADLESVSHQVLEKMTTGWVNAKLEDNPGIITPPENTKDFELFIKDESLIKDEGELIRFIASKLLLENDVECNNLWSTPKFQSGKIYLWIRKSALANVGKRQFYPC